jgi:hypothetical protein
MSDATPHEALRIARRVALAGYRVEGADSKVPAYGALLRLSADDAQAEPDEEEQS